MEQDKAQAVTQVLERIRPELLGYLRRMVARTALAEDLLQTTAERALTALPRVPSDDSGARRWLFRVATNLALDALRTDKRWSRTVVLGVEAAAKDSAWFGQSVGALSGDPQMAAIAREHIAVCLGCTLRSLEPNEAAALLLREVYDFSIDEVAQFLEARPTQVKNWVQQARNYLRARYAETCALVNQQGACHQCEHLSELFTGTATNPLQGADATLTVRLKVIADQRRRRPGPWPKLFDRLLDDVLT